MLEALNDLLDQELISAFIQKVLKHDYSGTENKALQKSASLMGARIAGTSLGALIENQLPRQPKPVVDLLILLTEGVPDKGAEFTEPLAFALSNAMLKVAVPPDPHTIRNAGFGYTGESSGKDFHLIPELLAQLLSVTETLAGPAVTERLAAVMQVQSSVFDPLLMLAPTIQAAAEKSRAPGTSRSWLAPLWQHCATSLLARSGHPPAPPADWSQPIKIACSCADCRELEAFSSHPTEQIHRFRLKKERRQHLHQKIEAHTLDMTHVTDRKGSPQTLVCEKTRRRYELRNAQYRADLAAFQTLIALAPLAGCAKHPAIAAMQTAIQENPPLALAP